MTLSEERHFAVVVGQAGVGQREPVALREDVEAGPWEAP